jgi:hypothetical protein
MIVFSSTQTGQTDLISTQLKAPTPRSYCAAHFDWGDVLYHPFSVVATGVADPGVLLSASVSSMKFIRYA